MTGTPQSGYAMKLDRSALEEQRKLELPNWRDFEHQLFRLTRIVNNTDAPQLGMISDKAEFKIDFAEPQYANSPQEKIIEWQGRISSNVSTPIDWIMSENPDLDRPQAELVYMANKAVNNPSLTLAPLTVGEPEETDEGAEDEAGGEA
jgi:hypothetical protein